MDLKKLIGKEFKVYIPKQGQTNFEFESIPNDELTIFRYLDREQGIEIELLVDDLDGPTLIMKDNGDDMQSELVLTKSNCLILGEKLIALGKLMK